jgi:predicted exporter
VTVYLVLPALLAVLAARKKVESHLYLHSFGSDILLRAAMRHPRTTVAATLTLTLVLGLAALGLQFDDSIRNLRSPDNKGDLLRTEVVQAFGHRFSPMTIRIDGATDSEVLESARLLSQRLQRLVGGRQLSAIDTIAGIMPPCQRRVPAAARRAAWLAGCVRLRPDHAGARGVRRGPEPPGARPRGDAPAEPRRPPGHHPGAGRIALRGAP